MAESSGVASSAGRFQTGADLCTVDVAAALLQVHPKTVLRFIRDGRLPATKIGKSYRILRDDLAAFVGAASPAAAHSWGPRVTSVVDIPSVDAELARKWARSITNSLHSRPSGGHLSAEVVYDSELLVLKIIIIGSLQDTSSLLGLIQIWSEQLAV